MQNFQQLLNDLPLPPELPLPDLHIRAKNKDDLNKLHSLPNFRKVYISFDENIDGFVFPENIQEIVFHNFTNPLDNVTFPQELELFYLGGRYKHNLNNIKLNYVHHFCFGPNFYKSIDNFIFPKGVEVITFEMSKINEIDNVKFPDGLKTLNCVSPNFEFNNLPNTLKHLIINMGCEDDITNLPTGLELLRISSLYKDKVKKVPYGCKVQYI